ncbi:Highly reducing polyketide synthase FUM1 [Paramyrothecium foliicola]|nr:Highly reducing polyketide synthase FUM1 [Paramyrothecium foliicola]
MSTTIDDAGVRELDLHHLTKLDDAVVGTTEFSNSASSVSDAQTSIPSSLTSDLEGTIPIAVCGMGMRFPGNITTGEQLWDFLANKSDARGDAPSERYNAQAFHGKGWQGYFLKETPIDLFDPSLFKMSRSEVENLDPQHRIMLELTRETLEAAGETNWRGKDIGCYIGTWGDDWKELLTRDHLDTDMTSILGHSDFMIANKVSFEYDFRGPSLAVKTACSSSLVALHYACTDLKAGKISSAVVGGVNMLLSPSTTLTMQRAGVLSPDQSCKTFDADAGGYVRAEAANMVYLKRLDDAVRDGSPIRGILRSTASNHDGMTEGSMIYPSIVGQMDAIRKCYRDAGIDDFSKTAHCECHGTGTAVGDPVEATAVATVWRDHGGISIGSSKPNLGHSEGASGITSIIKSILALEHKMIIPNIKFNKPNPKIPWEFGVWVPTELTPWPEDRFERISINGFGLGGSNAHAILDSAASFGLNASLGDHPVPRVNSKPSPRLLVYSTGHAESTNIGSNDLADYIPEHLNELDDIAYTLSVRREKLPFRTFAVTDGTATDFAAVVKAPLEAPLVNFVFTGQGAQWASMGSKLLADFPIVEMDIELLDQALSTLDPEIAPTWKIREELLKPKESSKISSAEFSQPLCTAVQLVVVNLLRSWGIMPAAVIGHSSGEIAAAYASGVLTMQQAIICSYLRGYVTKKQTRRGGMAAIALGREAIQQYLVEGVTIACENSPSSVTLSGDKETLDMVVQQIKDSAPEVLARALHVDMAYHSDHMKEIGHLYEQLLSQYIRGGSPSVPFCSSVTGEICSDDESFGPSYWRQNLERPVLFSTTMERLLARDTTKKSLLIEIGPHAALQGPIRQIQQTSGIESAAYIATLKRNEDDSASLLRTIGQLFVQGVEIDFGALSPPGKVITTLPTYPWHREKRFWPSNRLISSWRLRQWPHHELLGSPVVECSSIEPSWRNLLRLHDVPWLRDHVVNRDVILPGAGYVIMACEAMRQVSDNTAKGFHLRNVHFLTAMTLEESKGTEIIFAMRPVKMTTSLDSDWYEFTVSSCNDTSWIKHCMGEVRVDTEDSCQIRQIQDLPRMADIAGWYKTAHSLGLHFGPHFQSLRQGKTTTHPLHNKAVAHISNKTYETQVDDAPYPHPTLVDSCLQLFIQATSRGLSRKIHGLVLPRSIGHAYIGRPKASGDITLEATADVGMKGDVNGSCVGVGDDNRVVIHLEDTKSSSSGDRDDEDVKENVRVQWQPDIYFQDINQLISCKRDRASFRAAYQKLQKQLLLCCIEAKSRLASSKSTEVEHLEKFRKWIENEIEVARLGSYLHVEDTPAMFKLSTHERYEAISRLELELQPTTLAALGTGVKRVLDSLEEIYAGTTSGLDVLRQDNLLTRVYNIMHDWDYSKFIKLLAHRTPTLRILEIGAGTGATTALLLPHLISEHGERMYSSYVFTDISAGFFGSAKERFEGIPGLAFQVLDISRDPVDQGFKMGSFDLIVAANVIHATPNLEETLSNCRKLLRPSGKLMLQEIHSAMKSPNFVMGSLSGWWLGEADGRTHEPYVAPTRWAEALNTCGFNGTEAVVLDDDEPWHMNAVIVASPKTQSEARVVNILSADTSSPAARGMTDALQKRGISAQFVDLSDTPPKEGIISVLDLEGTSVLDGISSERFGQLQSFLARATGTILWLTKPCQLRCVEPQYAAIIGLTRVLRNEASINITTLELDEVCSEGAMDAIYQIYQKIHVDATSDEGDIDPDREYAWSNGEIHVPRCHWFSVKEELAIGHNDQGRRSEVLEIGKAGSLSTLRWALKPLQALGPDDVEIKVSAVSMNFKDVLVAMGIVEGYIGSEGAGTITAIGDHVTELQVGDRVAYLSKNGYATSITTPAAHCMKIPDSLEFQDAATMPIVYGTVIHSLMNIANLKAGQRVLIHSACGGVGLAAIQICRMIGADIYTTVGSEEKINYLVENLGIPRNRIFSSRDLSFKADVLRATNGQGVDVVLNSLSGELLHASWECVAEFGIMVEIGKRDFIGQGRLAMEAFEQNRTFCGLDMTLLMNKKPELVYEIFHQLMEFHRAGAIQPISPITAFEASNVRDAFRSMQKGQHIGKLVVNVPDNGSGLHATPKRRDLQFQPCKSYFLVGGQGGLGRSISIWMAERGAKHLIYLSRSGGKTPEGEALSRDLEAAGCSMQAFAGSVNNLSDVQHAISNAKYPIGGILQLSMVLRDKPFENMSYEDWTEVVSPKILGTWNLHKASENQSIDFFVLFSSMAGLNGWPGQANYAAGNCFQDAFVQARHAKGLPASVLDLGPVEDVGYVHGNAEVAAKLQAISAYFVKEEAVLDGLELAITLSLPRGTLKDSPIGSFVSASQFALGARTTTPLSSANNRSQWKRDPRFSVYCNIKEAEDVADAATASGNQDDGLRTFLLAAKASPETLDGDEQVAELAHHIGAMLCELMMKPVDELDLSVGVAALGIDSLVAIELRNWFRQKLGLEISVLEILSAVSLLTLAQVAAQALKAVTVAFIAIPFGVSRLVAEYFPWQSLLKQRHGRPTVVTKSYKGRTALITGANGAFGSRAAKIFAHRDVKTLVLVDLNHCGDLKEQIEAELNEMNKPLPEILIWQIDMMSFSGCQELGRKARDLEKLDHVLLTAGILAFNRRESPEGWETTLQVNFLSTALIALLLLPLLKASPGNPSPPVLTFVTSFGIYPSSFTLSMPKKGSYLKHLSNNKDGMQQAHQYGRSKALLLYFARELAARVSAVAAADKRFPKVTINSADPGSAWTPLTSPNQGKLIPRLITNFSARDPQICATALVNGVSATEAGHGKIMHDFDTAAYPPFMDRLNGRIAQQRTWEELRSELEAKVPEVKMVFEKLDIK